MMYAGRVRAEKLGWSSLLWRGLYTAEVLGSIPSSSILLLRLILFSTNKPTRWWNLPGTNNNQQTTLDKSAYDIPHCAIYLLCHHLLPFIFFILHYLFFYYLSAQKNKSTNIAKNGGQSGVLVRETHQNTFPKHARVKKYEPRISEIKHQPLLQQYYNILNSTLLYHLIVW